MSLIFYSFLLIWTSQLFNSERVLLWIIKIIIEAGKKSQENTTYKKGQAYTKETLQVMIHFIEGIFFFFVKSFVIKILYAVKGPKQDLICGKLFRMVRNSESLVSPKENGELFPLPSFQP